MSGSVLQDYTPIILKKKPIKQDQNKQGNAQTKLRYQAGKNIQNKSDINMRKIDNEEIRFATATLDIKKIMQETRSAKGWTQEDLARNCGLPKQIIRDYENGKAIVKQSEIAKINKALGIHIKKPENIKIKSDNY
jgi:ribosome-binding protein aMBF1 (putative translation factor)